MGLLRSLIQVFYGKLVTLSPKIELLFRGIYWRNVSRLKSLNKSNFVLDNNFTELHKLTEFLKSLFREKDEILIVHSSFFALGGLKETPKKIINEFVEILGPTGTLAMNGGRIFPGEEEKGLYENYNVDEVTTYDVRKSKVWTGALPMFMVRDTRAIISEFPINSMVAIGSEAENMMRNNIMGYQNSSCGSNSAWKYCTDKDALIVGIGIDLVHSLTIMHVAEENKVDWPIKNWFRVRRFNVINGDDQKLIEIKERKPKWGTLHFAEKNFRKDLLKAGILKSMDIDGLKIEYLRSMELYTFLEDRNANGYPYFNW